MNLQKTVHSNPYILYCLFILLVLAGLKGFFSLERAVDPKITPTIIGIKTYYASGSPKEIQEKITRHILDRVKVMPGLKNMRAESSYEWSRVILYFDQSSLDILSFEEAVGLKLQGIVDIFPQGVQFPKIYGMGPHDEPILELKIEGGDEIRRSQFINRELIPRLQQIDGVENVISIGALKKEVEVDLDLRGLKKYELPSLKIKEALDASGQTVGFGQESKEGILYNYEMTGDQFQDLSALGQSVVKFYQNQIPIHLSQVATLSLASSKRDNVALLNGRPIVLLSIYAQSKANVQKILKETKALIEEKNKSSRFFKITTLFSSTIILDQIFTDIGLVSLIFWFLPGIVLGALYRKWKLFFLTILVLLFCYSGAFLCYFLDAGASLNLVTFLAILLSFSFSVDHCVRCQESLLSSLEKKNRLQSVCLRVPYENKRVNKGLCILFSVAFALLFLFDTSTLAPFFYDFPLVIIPALIAVLAAQQWLIPIFFFRWGMSESKVPPFLKNCEAKFMLLLKRSLRKKYGVVSGIFFLSFIAFVLLLLSPQEGISSKEYFHVLRYQLSFPQAASLEHIQSTLESLTENLSQDKNIESTLYHMKGEGERAIFAYFFLKKTNSSVTDAVNDRLLAFMESKGGEFFIKPFFQIGESGFPIQLLVSGKNLPQIEEVTQETYESLLKNPEIKNLKIEYNEKGPFFNVILDLKKMSEFGILSHKIAEELKFIFSGSTTSDFYFHQDPIKIKFRNKEDLEKDFTTIYVSNINGTMIPLSSFSEIRLEDAPETLLSWNLNPALLLQGQLQHRGSVEKIVDHLERGLDTFEKKEDLSFDFLGQSALHIEMRDLWALGLIALFLVYLVTSTLVESFGFSWIPFIAIFPACIGLFLAVLICGYVDSMIGFMISLIPISFLFSNSLRTLDFYRKELKKDKGYLYALLVGSRRNFRSSFLVTFLFILLALPLIFGFQAIHSFTFQAGIMILFTTLCGWIFSTLATPLLFALLYPVNRKIREKLHLKNNFFEKECFDEDH